MAKSRVEMIEDAAEGRHQAPVPREFIEEALRRIDAGETKVLRYAGGLPSLRQAYDLAVQIQQESEKK